MKNKGAITIWVLVFGTIFIILLSGIFSYLIFEIKQTQKIIARNLAFHIAEAGINYARWRLAHASTDYDFSGIYDYKDSEGTIIGQYQLIITPPTGCNQGVKIQAIGWKLNSENEDLKRKIFVTYAKPSFAKYAFLTNSNVWFGSEESLKGIFHSNGGIRMDGEQNSLGSSARETYICGPEHGCSFSNCLDPCSWTISGCECPGIWGAGKGGEIGLWQFPVSNVDFNKIIHDLAILKEKAQKEGIYISSPTRHGFHLKFKSDGTMDVYTIVKLKNKVWGYDGEKWVYESNAIEREEFFANYSLPENCAPIFVDNNVWVEGEINGRVTVVAAKLPETPASLKKIIIWGNIKTIDNDSVLGLIAQKDILIPLYSPERLEIEAALLAQKGHIFRYYYPNWPWEPYRSYAIREYIETYGSLITNTIWTFSWVDFQGRVVSGYKETEMNYKPALTFNPPPYFPVSGEYEIVSWEEKE